MRWQQTGASGSTSSSVAKLLLYGVAGAGVGTAVTVAYANYDPIFKNRVNEYIPVFGQLSDSVADKWVSLSDSRRQKGSSDVGLTATNQMVSVHDFQNFRHTTLKPIVVAVHLGSIIPIT